MTKIRYIVFVVTIAILCFSAIGNKALQYLVDEYSAQRVSMLEGRKYQSFPRDGIQSYLSGSFQSNIEQYMADLVPGRDSIILAHSKMQRASIEMANVIAGFPVYPSFYGSSYFYDPGRGTIMEKPYDLSRKHISSVLEAYSTLISSNQKQHWIFAMPLRPGVFANAEPARLSNNNTDYAWIKKNFLSKLPKNCGVVDLSCDSKEQYLNLYYKTDHHWRIQGAVRAYEKVMGAFGRDPIEIKGFYAAYKGPFWGSAARAGACAEGSGDVLFDVLYDSAELTLTGPYGPLDSEWLGGSNGIEKHDYEKPERFSNVYSDYFHTDVAYLEIKNESAIGQGSLLIVGNSSTNCIERLFAQNYETVYKLDLRYYTEKTVQEFLDTQQVDDVLIMLTANDFAQREVVDGLNETRWSRIAGENALATNQSATRIWGDQSTYAVITADQKAAGSSGYGYNDALAAASLAGALDAPILMTHPTQLANTTKNELNRLKATTVYIVGSTAEVDESVEAEIRKNCPTVKTIKRIGDKTISARAVSVARETVQVSDVKPDTVIIAMQQSFRDALSISSYSYASKTPILYLETPNGSAGNALDDATLSYIKDAGYKKAIIIGGPLVIPESVEEQLTNSAGIQTDHITRIAGANAYNTSYIIAKWSTGELEDGTGGGKGFYRYTDIKFQPAVELGYNNIGIVQAHGWRDGVSAAALCGKNKSVILAVDREFTKNLEMTERRKPFIKQGYVFGGELAITEEVYKQIEDSTA